MSAETYKHLLDIVRLTADLTVLDFVRKSPYDTFF